MSWRAWISPQDPPESGKKSRGHFGFFMVFRVASLCQKKSGQALYFKDLPVLLVSAGPSGET